MTTQIQLRRDLAANWTSFDPILAEGEPGLELDTGKVKYGDGVTAWSLLPYASESALTGYATETYVDNAIGNIVIPSTDWANISNKPSFFSGDYNDLSNKPALFSGDYNDLSNTPSLFSGSYLDLTDTPTIPSLDGYATETYVTNAIANVNVGNPFDQDLNTSNSVTFTDVTLSSGGVFMQNGGDIYSINQSSIDIYTDWDTGNGVEVWLKHGQGVEVNTENGQYRWTFDNTGNLIFPDNTVQTTAYDPTVLQNYATQNYVGNAIADLVNSAPDALNTLKELADALGNTDSTASGIINTLANKADISSIPTSVSALTNDAGYITTWGQADWNESVTESPSYIQNKPSIPTDIANLSDNTGLLGGNYSDSNVTTLLGSFGSNSISTGGTITANSITLYNSDNFSQILFSDDGGATDNGHIKVDGGKNMVVDAISNFYVKQASSDRLAITNTDSILGAASNVVVKSAGSTHEWTFDSSGIIHLPIGGDIVDSNGTTVLGGGASTGTFGFSGLTMQNTDRSDLTIRNIDLDSNTYDNELYMSTQMIQMYAYNPSVENWSELNLNNFDTPNVTIQVAVNNKQVEWTFGADSTTTVPGNIQTTQAGYAFSATNIIAVSTGTTVTVTLGTAIFGDPFTGIVKISGVVGTTEINGTWYYQASEVNQFVLYTDNTYSTTVDGSAWTAYVSGGSAIADGLNDISISAGTINVISGGTQWTFTDDGKIHLPTSGDIVDSNGMTVLGVNPFDQSLNTTDGATFNGLSITNGSTIIVEQGTQIHTLPGSTGSIDLYTDTMSGNGVEVYLEHDSGVTISTASGTHQWSFDRNGIMRGPHNVTQQAIGPMGCLPNVDTVIYTGTNALTATIKALFQIEGNEQATSSYEAQSCEMIVARMSTRVAGSVYGLAYTGANPLATLNARINSTTNLVEITCRPTSTTDAVYVTTTGTELLTTP